MKKISGIYQIINKKTKRMYIGCSFDINTRFTQHMNKLKKGEHHSFKFQFAYNLSNGKDDFDLVILEDCTNKNCKNYELIEKETNYINDFYSNIFGYNMTNNLTTFQQNNKYNQNIYEQYLNIDRNLSWDLSDLKYYKQKYEFYKSAIEWSKNLNKDEIKQNTYEINYYRDECDKLLKNIKHYLSWINTSTENDNLFINNEIQIA